MEIKDIEKLIKEFAELGGQSIKPFWRGEPTMDKRLPYILEYAKKYKLKTMINTNSSFPFNNVPEILLNLDWLSLSIDKEHDNLWAIKFLPAIAIFREFHNPALYIEIQSCEYISELEYITKELNIKYKIDKPVKRKDTDNKSIELCGMRKYCGFPAWRIVVAYNGDVTHCCVDWKLENKLGNAFEMPLKDIYAKAQVHLSSLLINKRYNSNICKNCTSKAAYNFSYSD